MTPGDDRFLSALAAAMSQHPRGTYQELAIAVGVSRATLYRYCRSKDELILRLLRHAVVQLNKGLEEAKLGEGDVREGLKRLINSYLINKEFVAVIAQYWVADTELDPEIDREWEVHQSAIDAFFLRGQQEGVFRINIGAAALNEALCWLLVGLVDGERRGRVTRAGLASTIEELFLAGAQVSR